MMDLEILRFEHAGVAESIPKCAFSPDEAKITSCGAYDFRDTESVSSKEEGNGFDNELETSLIESILRDEKVRFLAIRGSGIDRTTASKLLRLCCLFDSFECAASLVNGELGAVPLVNEADFSGMTPLHTAAESQAARCVEMLLKKRARTDLKTKDGRSMLPLELALCSARLDVTWNPDDHSIEDLVVQLTEKDLKAVKLLSEKTKQIDDVAYASAMGGRVVDLAILLIVAAEKVNKSILALHDADSGSKEKTTIYECVIREALALGRAASSLRAAKRNCVPTKSESAGKRKLLLCAIELLQLFGADSQTAATEKKVASPLILASQAGDEAIVELILKTNIDINEADAEGNTALHWCLKTSRGSFPQQTRIMWMLLENGARVSQRNKLGLNAVHTAAASGNSEALQVLLLEDPNCIHAKTEMKETPLFFAAKNDCKECVQLLLRWGASTEVFNLRKQRPIDLAESQDLRFMLHPTNISLTNCALPVQQKYTALLQGDEIISETCKELLALDDEGNSSNSCSNMKTEVCKYFSSPTGCVRGTKCFYAHDEEDLQQIRMKRENTHLHSARDLERKIFVGGLPSSLDSDSLRYFFQEQFGPVDDAIVIGVQVGDKIHSRGFGFVTFKNRTLVSAAVEAHYVTIMGKQVEIKSAVPKCLLQAELQKLHSQNEEEQSDGHLVQDQSPEHEITKDVLDGQLPVEKTKTKIISCKTTEEDKSDVTSWVDKLMHGQAKTGLVESQENGKSMPRWLRTFKKWLPGFLWQLSKRGGEYALSSLKADFRTAFGLELDHASLGYPKLSDFMRLFPELCRVQFVPIGRQKSANHMIILPILSKPHLRPPESLTIPSPSSSATSIGDSSDGDSNDTKSFQDLSALSDERDDSTGDGVELSHKKPQESQENTTLTVQSRFLQFLKPDPIFHARPWLYSECNGGAAKDVYEKGQVEAFQGRKPRGQGRHLVLAVLARKQNNSSVFFLREFDFYDKYKASIREGKCFMCNQPKLLFANYPCRHLLWCVECQLAAKCAAGTFEHRCVVCDALVWKTDVVQSHESPHPIYNMTFSDNFPPFDPYNLRRLHKSSLSCC